MPTPLTLRWVHSSPPPSVIITTCIVAAILIVKIVAVKGALSIAAVACSAILVAATAPTAATLTTSTLTSTSTSTSTSTMAAPHLIIRGGCRCFGLRRRWYAHHKCIQFIHRILRRVLLRHAHRSQELQRQQQRQPTKHHISCVHQWTQPCKTNKTYRTFGCTTGAPTPLG